MLFIRHVLSFADRGNMTLKSISTQEPQHNNTASVFTPRNINSVIFGSAYILSFLVNLRVIHVVYSRLSNRIKMRFSVRVLVVHLSLICTGITLSSALSSSQLRSPLKIFGPIVCQASVFVKGNSNFELKKYNLHFLNFVRPFVLKYDCFLNRFSYLCIFTQHFAATVPTSSHDFKFPRISLHISNYWLGLVTCMYPRIFHNGVDVSHEIKIGTML